MQRLFDDFRPVVATEVAFLNRGKGIDVPDVQSAIEKVYSEINRTNPTLEIVSVKDFGAKGDGVTDDTQAIQNAVNYAHQSQKTLVFPPGTYFISRENVRDKNTAITIPGAIKIRGYGGVIKSDISEVAKSIFGFNDSPSSGGQIIIDGLICKGDRRFFLIRFASESFFDAVIIKNCITDTQSISVQVNSNYTEVSNNVLGVIVPTKKQEYNDPVIEVMPTNERNEQKDQSIIIHNNTVFNNGENNVFFVYNMHGKVRVTNNTAYRFNPSTNGDCFDLDDIGKNSIISGNIGFGGHFDIKISTGSDYESASDLLVTDNISINSPGGAFSIRTPGVFSNLIAINPKTHAFTISGFEDISDKTAHLHVTNCIAYYDNEPEYYPILLGPTDNIRILLDNITISPHPMSDKDTVFDTTAIRVASSLYGASINNIYIRGFKTAILIDANCEIKNCVFNNIHFENVEEGINANRALTIANTSINNIFHKPPEGNAVTRTIFLGVSANIHKLIVNTPGDIDIYDFGNRNWSKSLSFNNYSIDPTTVDGEPDMNGVPVGTFMTNRNKSGLWLKTAHGNIKIK